MGSVRYNACCKRWAIRGFEDPEVILWCRHMAAWLTAGSDISTMTNPQLRWFHGRATFCPPLAFVARLAILAPQLHAPASFETEVALLEAEGVLQWFIDNMVPMLGFLETQRFAAFFVVHRILAAANSGTATPLAGSASSARSELPAAMRARVDALEHSLRWGTAYAPDVVAGLLADVWASVGLNASRVRPAAAPLPCSLEAALALAALADLVRLERGAESIQFHWSLRAIQRCLDDVTTRKGPLLRQLQGAAAVPLLLALDRLECRPEISVVPNAEEKAAGMRTMVVQLLPFRDWESDFMRAYHNFHCGEQVKGLVQRRMPLDRDGMFVDVGANLGGCALWASSFASDMRVMAIEPYGAAVDAMQATVQKNALADRVQVLQACIRHDGREKTLKRVVPSDPGEWAVLQVGWQLVDSDAGNDTRVSSDAGTGMESVPCARLDEVVDGRVAVLRIHTSGTELSALASAAGLVERGLLGAVALQFPTLPMARLLWSYGMDLEMSEQSIRRGDEAQFQAVLEDDPSGHAVLVGVSNSGA